jgi:hypothetical protein
MPLKKTTVPGAAL